jgi:alkylation response protein AidB-like acyl-CoA dehydrogenase
MYEVNDYDAHLQFTEAGWPSLLYPKEYGGQGLPGSNGGKSLMAADCDTFFLVD